ncbi:hypothetical protein C900_05032 [Fulvivirga imtechensis AK7]|uniref:CBU-0592-like domain-containing protein n=1 Tax=Fulvivirga imtechensis AK7 TaxID=1237149 RepID=L8JL20_9BACT|nr:hypothetical protein [Fulvivirga imtechensis]ELR69500.1 hypothetical protein C900_05032 [Fulvivirga imtechensis AK7]
MTAIDWVGSLGVFLILMAYFLNVSGRLSNRALAYILLNLCGAALACLASALLEYIPFIILEGAWVLVSTHSLLTYLKRS